MYKKQIQISELIIYCDPENGKTHPSNGKGQPKKYPVPQKSALQLSKGLG